MPVKPWERMVVYRSVCGIVAKRLIGVKSATHPPVKGAKVWDDDVDGRSLTSTEELASTGTKSATRSPLTTDWNVGTDRQHPDTHGADDHVANRLTYTETRISTDYNTLTHTAWMTILLTDRQTHRHASVLTITP